MQLDVHHGMRVPRCRSDRHVEPRLEPGLLFRRPPPPSPRLGYRPGRAGAVRRSPERVGVDLQRQDPPDGDSALARLDLSLTGLPSPHLFVAISALTYPAFFGLLTLAVLALDVLGKDAGQPTRLTEFTALSFYTQVPYCLLMILIAWVWVPDPIRLPPICPY